MLGSYNNLPKPPKNNSFGQQAFVNFFTDPIEVDAATFDALTGFFISRGFEETAALSISTTLIYQAKKDNVNAMKFIDLLKGYDNVQLNSLMAEILNYNRYKTSFLGFGPNFTPNPAIARNILP
jgi:hypothetical protein